MIRHQNTPFLTVQALPSVIVKVERGRESVRQLHAPVCEDVKMEGDIVPDRKVIEAVFPKCSLMYRDVRKHSVRLKA